MKKGSLKKFLITKRPVFFLGGAWWGNVFRESFTEIKGGSWRKVFNSFCQGIIVFMKIRKACYAKHITESFPEQIMDY